MESAHAEESLGADRLDPSWGSACCRGRQLTYPRKWLSAKGLDSSGEVVIPRLRQEFPQACRLGEIHCPLRL